MPVDIYVYRPTCMFTSMLQTHMPVHFYAKEFKEKQPKVIVVMRNPKDALTSYYHMMKAIPIWGDKYKGIEGFATLFEVSITID